MASLLVLLFRSLVSSKGLSCLNTNISDNFLYSARKDWEYAFAMQICGQFSCLIWLPSLVMILQLMGQDDLSQELVMQLLFAIDFVSHKLQDPEFTLMLESRENSDSIQVEIHIFFWNFFFKLVQYMEGRK